VAARDVTDFSWLTDQSISRLPTDRSFEPRLGAA
jgi:hypothetical protein